MHRLRQIGEQCAARQDNGLSRKCESLKFRLHLTFSETQRLAVNKIDFSVWNPSGTHERARGEERIQIPRGSFKTLLVKFVRRRQNSWTYAWRDMLWALVACVWSLSPQSTCTIIITHELLISQKHFRVFRLRAQMILVANILSRQHPNCKCETFRSAGKTEEKRERTRSVCVSARKRESRKHLIGNLLRAT